MVKNLDGTNQSSNPSSLTNVNGHLFFVAFGNQLWESDGTGAGTTLANFVLRSSDPKFPLAVRSIKELTVLNGELYFVGVDNTATSWLWKINDNDGYPKAQLGEDVANLTGVPGVNNEDFLFTHDTYITSSSGLPELRWSLVRTNGTSYTILMNLIGPDMPRSRSLVSLGDNKTFIFSAQVGNSGLELFRTDGTPQGTALVTDIAPGSASSDPWGFTVVGPLLFFFANDGVHGDELWAMPIANFIKAP
jgi:ELWxxDGT repeat protein